MKDRVVVQVPLKVERTVMQKHTGNNGRGVARLGEKSNSREVDRTVENIALIRYQGAAKRGRKKVLRGDRPGEKRASRTILVVARRLVRRLQVFPVGSRRVGRQVLGTLITLSGRLGLLGEEAVDDAVFHAAGVRHDVAVVEAD